MPKKPQEPLTGKRPPAGWDHDMWAFMCSLIPTGDSRFIKVSHTDNGVSFSVNFDKMLEYIPLQSGGGRTAAHNGYFALRNTSDEDDQKITIYDGMTEDFDAELNAGDCYVNDELFEDVEATELTLTGSQYYIYLEAEYDIDNEVISAPTITAYTSKQQPAEDTAYCLLYRVKLTDGVISATSREFHGMPQLIIWGAC